jgi:hypothetical protein
MKIMSNTIILTNLINTGFKYVMETSKQFKIDESHSLKHSMEVFGYAKKIFESEVYNNPILKTQEDIIYMSAIGHDMCDKKYMDEKEGINKYKNYLSQQMEEPKLEVMGKIIETMSYSKVKMNGYPNLGKYQLAYHIVREADLLAAYDLDRCIIYKMYKDNTSYTDSLSEALTLFDKRVFKMRDDGLFLTNYSIKESLILHYKAKKEVENLREYS